MSLPRIVHPTFDVVIPSTGKTATFRPFLVREEKVLLMAQQTDSEPDLARALVDIIDGCCMTPGLSASKMTLFDLEYVFIKLRSRSVNSVARVSYRDIDDGETYSFDVDLETVEVVFPPCEKKIRINDEIGMVLKWPTVAASISLGPERDPTKMASAILISCIDSIYDADTTYSVDDASKTELAEFIDQLPLKAYEGVTAFFESLPRLSYTIRYTNSKGRERSIELRSVKDFFTWR